MIFAVSGLFKERIPPHRGDFEAAINEHLGQPLLHIVNAGYLHDAAGKRIGVLALLDVPSFAQAQAFLDDSPFQRDGDYDRVQVAEYRVEVGRLG